jgi:hypothetical protein
VRFQIYEAKTIDNLQQMRQQMHEKFDELSNGLANARKVHPLSPKQQ